MTATAMRPSRTTLFARFDRAGIRTCETSCRIMAALADVNTLSGATLVEIVTRFIPRDSMPSHTLVEWREEIMRYVRAITPNDDVREEARSILVTDN